MCSISEYCVKVTFPCYVSVPTIAAAIPSLYPLGATFYLFIYLFISFYVLLPTRILTILGALLLRMDPVRRKLDRE